MSSAKNLAVQLYSAAGFGESTADLAWDGHGLVADRGELLAETRALRARRQRRRRRRRSARRCRATACARRRSGRTPPQHARALRRVARAAPAPTRRARGALGTRSRRRVDPHPVRARPIRRSATIAAARSSSSRRRRWRSGCDCAAGGRAARRARRLRRPGLDAGAPGRRARDGSARPAAHATSSASPCRASAPRTRTYAARLRARAGARRDAARDRHPRARRTAMFAAIGHDPTRRGRHLRERAGVDAQDRCSSRSRRRCAASISAPATCPSWRSASPPTAATTCRTTASTPASRRRSSRSSSAGPRTSSSRDEPAVAAALRDVLDTPISPELLRPGPDGEIRAALGRAGRVPTSCTTSSSTTCCASASARGASPARRWPRSTERYAIADIRRWLLVFLRRFFANQFKRDCVPDAPKVGSGGSLSPRGDWRMPSDASPAAWLAEAEAIPASLDEGRPALRGDAGRRAERVSRGRRGGSSS